MIEKIPINPETPWGKASRLKRRMHGFVCYIVCAFFALYAPEATDWVLFKALQEQFKITD